MEYLNSSRPTAVNLSWALNRMHSRLLSEIETKSIEELKQILRDKLSAECDTDALVDAYLQQEEELEKADETERRESER